MRLIVALVREERIVKKEAVGAFRETYVDHKVRRLSGYGMPEPIKTPNTAFYSITR